MNYSDYCILNVYRMHHQNCLFSTNDKTCKGFYYVTLYIVKWLASQDQGSRKTDLIPLSDLWLGGL